MAKKLFGAPRWKGGPRICMESNLPAFRTIGDHTLFHDSLAPGVIVHRVYQCETCKNWHAVTSAPGASQTATDRRKEQHV